MTRTAPSLQPPLLRFAAGGAVSTREAWPRRRAELQALLVEPVYGGLPPAAPARAEELHTQTVRRLNGARYITYRVTVETQPPVSFLLQLLVPPGRRRCPVVLTGDGCWRNFPDAIEADLLGRRIILAVFNRVELAPDTQPPGPRRGPLHAAFPDHPFGAVAAWAWGYHRCVDVLLTHPRVDPRRIGVTGHSRGGKASLLAGATDERIALTSANNSGAGGAGSFSCPGPGAERLADCVRAFPHWFGPALAGYVGREQELPFDLHFLKALVAPRALVTTEALGDDWANPSGTWITHQAAREVYRLLGAEKRIGIWFREGAHAQGPDDWHALLDFLETQLLGRRCATDFQRNPFPHLAT